MRNVVHHSSSFKITNLNQITATHKLHERAARTLGKRRDHRPLQRVIAITVTDNPCQPGVAPACESLYRPCDVIRRIDAHKTPRTNEVDFACKPFTDGHRKPAAHDVPEHVVDGYLNLVGFERLEVFKDLESSEHPASGTADSWLWTASFNAVDAAWGLEDDVVKRYSVRILPVSDLISVDF